MCTVIQQNWFSHESYCGASSGPESYYVGFSPRWNLSLTDLWVLVFPAPDGPPQEVHLEPISSQSIRVTWKVNPASMRPPGTFSIGGRGEPSLTLSIMMPRHAHFFNFYFILEYGWFSGLPPWLSSKESTCKVEDVGSIPGLERSPGGGRGNPLQYSCLENPMDRGAWWATVHGVTKSRTCLKQWACMHSWFIMLCSFPVYSKWFIHI